MKAQQVILALAAVLVAFALFFLPRGIIKPEESKAPESTVVLEEDSHDHSNHEEESPENEAIKKLRFAYLDAVVTEKKLIFADSLAKAFDYYGKFDSVAKYKCLIYRLKPSVESQVEAGNALFRAFTYSVDRTRAMVIVDSLKSVYKSVDEKHTHYVSAEAQLSMTNIMNGPPMQAILAIRKLAEENPENYYATFALGLLSIQSGQYDKAKERFKHLIDRDSAAVEALYYLGLVHLELKEEKEAAVYLEKVIEVAGSTFFVQSAASALNGIKK